MKHALSVFALCVFLAGCEGVEDTSSATAEADTSQGLCPGSPECDPGADEPQPPEAEDTQEALPIDPEEEEANTPPPEPLFEIGTNITGANTPDSFSLLNDGDSLNIELGFQGLWMVVLSFRTQSIFKGKLTIITQIDVAGETQGELGLAKQKLIPSGGSLDYYYNLFLVVMDPSVSGQVGNISLSVSDDHGALIEETIDVQLIGGTSR